MNPEEKKRPSYHFKMVKTDIHHDPTPMMYAKWGVLILFFGISSVSFITQGALALYDTVTGKYSTDVAQVQINGQNHLPSKTLVSEEQQAREPLGSDDGKITPYEGEPQYRLANISPLAKMSARAYLAADLETGEIIVEQNDGLVAPVASVTKLMTGLIAYEQMDMQKIAIVSRDSYNTYGAQGGLLLGEKIRVYDLMYPLLMESSNDAAEVIADAYEKGHEAFLREMNKKAQELGMTDTYYEDPSGLNPKNVSTVRDLLILGRYIYEQAPVLYDMTRVKQYAIRKHTWLNKNRFLTYENFLGGKNGYIDEAKKTTVSLFDVVMAKGGKRSVAIVLLKSDDREGDALKLINYLKKNAYFDVSGE